mgnify:CR=1 FL=1
MSNLVISVFGRFIPDKVRIPVFIVIIASFVTIVDLFMKAYLNTPGPNGEPSLYDNLGLFIPLIVVNCIVLGRAEAFASKNSVFSSIIDGVAIGIGFAFALSLLGAVRELLGNYTLLAGTSLEVKLIDTDGMLVFVLAPGAFLALGYLIMIMNKIKNRTAKA